jgi:hypothetical protein
MRTLIIVILLLSLIDSGYGQTFLDAYKKYRLDRADTLSNTKTKKKIKSFIKSQIIELDTVFQSYKSKYNFDFNIADTIFLIYDSPAESPFTSDVIIWSNRDTISYKQGFETTKTGRNQRIITYQPFIQKSDKPEGFRVITERDSLITLVSKKDFETINKLGDGKSMNGGSWIDIYLAYRTGSNYKIESYSPKQFIIWTTYQKE